MSTKSERIARFHQSMERLGIDYATAQQLRRIEMTLHRWHELECGDGNDCASWSIERDETTGKPYMVTHPHNGKTYRRAIPDRESGALKRLSRIMAKLPLWAYVQTDPRGCALYVGRCADIKAGEKIAECYIRGVAVCY